jgi:hypothetical protein
VIRPLSLSALLLLGPWLPAQDVRIVNGDNPVKFAVVTLDLPDSGKPGRPMLKEDNGGLTLPLQFDGAKKTATVVVPKLGPKEKLDLAVFRSLDRKAVIPHFGFTDSADGLDYLRDGQPALRFANAKRDGTTKDTHELTFKPFHHVFDPVKGETLLTNGPGLAANKDLLFPHHRGLFFAFNKVSYGDQKCDVWHGRNGEYVVVDKSVSQEAGDTYARQTAALSWHGTKGDTFATELRTVSLYRAAGGHLIDFESTVSTTLPSVKLDGDPQHAGFHFRAAMEVAKNGKANTYYLRPDGKGKPGDTRNWDAKAKDPKTVNLPWDACSFVVKDQRYTVLRVPHPTNPKETRGSERDYGRFGDYFEWTLTPTTPLTVKYRVWVQPGEMTVEECQAIADGYAKSPTVKVG